MSSSRTPTSSGHALGARGKRFAALLALSAVLWAAPGVPNPVKAAVVRPSARSSAAMTYDGASQTVVLFGGHEEFADRGEEMNDTWAWNGTVWKKRNPAVSPPPREGATMAYDAVSRTVVLFGGTSEVCGVFSDDSCAKLNDTWTWEGISRTWTQRLSPVSPAPRSDASMAYDKVSGKVVLFGGKAANSTPFGDTWTWDGTTMAWTLQTPASSPPSRFQAVMAPQGKGLVLFSGERAIGASGPSNDTWTWNSATSTWTEQTPSTPPPFRAAAAMAYDAARQRAVLFSGGGVCCAELTDTWLWNATEKSWTLATTTGPQARFAASIAYDAARQRVVLFGGQTPRSGTKNDTWSWNGTAWKQKA